MKQATAVLLAESRRSPDAAPFPPRKIYDEFQVAHRFYDHRPAFWITPEQPSMRVLYLHGGAYYNECVPAHWSLIKRLCRKLNAEVVVPDYPLTPVYGYRDVFSMVTQVYRDCLADIPHGQLVLAGDSAGGGIALALCQWAKLEMERTPSKLVLISPWLDITLRDPEIKELDKVDPFLESESLRQMGVWYCQGDNPMFYQVSPLFGNLEGLPPSIVFTGTRDILNSDARRFAYQAQKVNSPITLWEEQGMIHTWMLFPIEEAQTALKAMEQFLQDC